MVQCLVFCRRRARETFQALGRLNHVSYSRLCQDCYNTSHSNKSQAPPAAVTTLGLNVKTEKNDPRREDPIPSFSGGDSLV